MSLEALPTEILHHILDLSRPHDFESLAVTCKKVYMTASYYLTKEHRLCKQNMHLTPYAHWSAEWRLRSLASPMANLDWLYQYAPKFPINQLRYVETINLDFPPLSDEPSIRALLERTRSKVPNLYVEMQQKSRNIFHTLSDGMTLDGGLEEASERLQDADLNFCPSVLCQLALTSLASNATVLIIAKGCLAYMRKTLERLLSISPPSTGFLRNIREVIIRDRGPYYNFGGRSLSALFKLPQLRAITIRDLFDGTQRSERRWPESLQSAACIVSHNVTVLVLIETIWHPYAATRVLSLFPKLRSFVWQPVCYGYHSPLSPTDVDEEEAEDYAGWFYRYREAICPDERRGENHSPTVRMSDHDAENIFHDAGQDLLQPTDDRSSSSDSDFERYYRRVITLRGRRGSRRGSRRGHGSQRSGYVSRSATNQQLVGGAADLATDNLVKRATPDEELDMDGPCLSDADEVLSLDWSHPDPFQPSILLEALSRLYGDQLEHLAVSVFGSAQAANQIAREDTVVHFLDLVKLTHLDLDTRILRPRKGSRYQHVSVHRVLPPSMKQLALTILYCFLSADLQNLLGQLPMHKSSLPRLGGVFVRVLMSETQAVSTEDEDRFERLRDELAQIGIDLRWLWVGPGTEVKPGLDWDDSRDIMPSTYSVEPDPR